MAKAILKICPRGHQFYKSSDCPTCPVCEELRKPSGGILSLVAAPARRALEREGIVTAADLVRYTERELLNLHGFGPGAIRKLKPALKKLGLSFRKPV